MTERKFPVTENGKTSWISADEVVLLQLLRNAMRGDSSAIKLLFPLIDRYRDSPEAPNAKSPAAKDGDHPAQQREGDRTRAR